MRLKSLRWGWGSRCAIGVVALAVVIPASASAQLVLRSFTDGASTSKSELTDLATELRSGCTRKVLAVKSMSLTTALAHIQSQLNRSSSAKARSAFARSKDAKTAANAASAVFGAIGDGKPWAAIDAGLRVQKLDGNDAGPLISLAGLVSTQGMPQEALALLSAATKRKSTAKSPMGIDMQAVASNNRGYALLLLGHPKQAIGYLQSAAKKAPLLSEARVNLDAAKQCNWVLLPGGSRGNPPVIADPPFWRQDQSGDTTTDEEGDPVQVASKIFDLSQKRSYTPVNVLFPGSVPEAANMVKSDGYYTSLYTKVGNQGVTDSTQLNNLLSKVHDANAQTLHRRLAVWHAMTTAEWQPQLHSLWQSYESQLAALDAATDNNGAAFSAGGALDPYQPQNHATKQCEGVSPWDARLACETKVCAPESASLLAQWKAQIAQVNDAELRYESAFWKYATGLAANLQDPADHQRMLLHAEELMLGNRGAVLLQASGYLRVLTAHQGNNDMDCVTGQAPPPAAGTVPAQQQSPACPKALKKLPNVKVGDIFSFAVHCEEIQVEIATKGWIGAFANITFNPKAGTATVFTGVQAGALGQQVREGAFIKSGPNGIEDGGIRINESTSGPAFMTQSHTVNFAVAGTVPFSE